jgi:glycine/D-amino acid oxidase-like deaminating enzyme/nitrite reductase/ring-hydroxylating ferredoxin subunit
MSEGRAMTTPAYWSAEAKPPALPRLSKDLHVDVCVVGGGITGVTAAYLLRKAGRSVALLERGRCCSVDTGHTTAHLTQSTDARLNKLVSRFGRDHAQAAWDAGRAAIEHIHETIHAENLDCHFAWVPGYLHAPYGQPADSSEIEELKEDARLAEEFGFDARYLDSVPLMGQPGIQFANQARFHPILYLEGLLRSLVAAGCQVFEDSAVTEVVDSPLTVKANDREVRCEFLVLATHVPLMGKLGLIGATLFQSKLALYTSYAISGRVPTGAVPDALFWDTADPYRYLRLDRQPDSDYLIYGGEDHKTGQVEKTAERFTPLEEGLAKFARGAAVTHQWSGQVVETNDGLPFIGEIAERQFIATGFSGNGMTFGTLSAMMARDAVQGKKNPWKDLFDPHRKRIGGVWDYVKENLDYPYYMLRDRLTSAQGNSLGDLKPLEGKILKIDGAKVAAYRDAKGAVITLTPVCTHMGCLVHWNKTESTWDCPCHGSRFRPDGKVLAGPAESPLQKVDAQTGEKH